MLKKEGREKEKGREDIKLTNYSSGVRRTNIGLGIIPKRAGARGHDRKLTNYLPAIEST